jgi:hypothetical protein
VCFLQNDKLKYAEQFRVNVSSKHEVLRRIFVLQREKVTEGAENNEKKNFTTFAILQVLLEGGYINKCETGGVCNTHVGNDKSTHNLNGNGRTEITRKTEG